MVKDPEIIQGKYNINQTFELWVKKTSTLTQPVSFLIECSGCTYVYSVLLDQAMQCDRLLSICQVFADGVLPNMQ